MNKKTYPDLDLKKGVDFIGVCVVFCCHDGKGKLLMHKRSKNCRDEIGTWDIGGGAVEFGEHFEEAVKREIREEYCVDAENVELVTVYNALRENGGDKTHWVAVLFVAEVDPKKVKIGDSEKMDEIGWFGMENLPNPLHSKVVYDLKIVKDKIFQS